ncbi:MAG: hypothetical protein WBA24_14185 [Geitlerinemataceae cyanobacterium]
MTQAQDNPNTDKENAGNDNAENDRTQSASSSLTARAGIIGVQCAALFALCFSLIGYSIYLSLLLATIAGIAIAAIINWWESDDETAETIQASISDEEIYGLRRRNRRNRQKRYLQARNGYLSRRDRKALTGLFFETGVGQLSPPDRPQTGSNRSAEDDSGDNPRNLGDDE